MLEHILYPKPKASDQFGEQSHYKPYSNYEIAKNIFALLGLMSVFLALFFIYQGYVVIKQHKLEFFDAMSGFLTQALYYDVASATLVKTPLDAEVSLIKAAQAIQHYVQHHTNLTLITQYSIEKTLTEQNLFLVDLPKPIQVPLLPKKSETVTLIEVFVLTDLKIAESLLRKSPNFAFYLPCHIVMYKALDGQIWLTTLNLSLPIYGDPYLNKEERVQALQMYDSLLKTMSAGASGVEIELP